jgi:hypothetical protein
VTLLRQRFPAPPLASDGPSLPRTDEAATVRRRRIAHAGCAFATYLLVSFALFGVPVLTHFTTRFAGAGRGDARFYAWALAWWPHALASGLDPFLTRAAWFPSGIDLAWVTGLPGPSLAMAPVTWLLGPVAADNVLTILAPALGGLGSYLLARRLTDRFWPALAGGYLFAFGTYEVAQLRGHVNLFLVFPVPFAAYLFVRAVDGTLGDRAFTLLLALTLAAQFLISIEVFATMTAFGAVALAGVAVLGPRDRRPRLARAAAGAGLAYALTVAAVAPYLYHLTTGRAPAGHPLAQASVDLLSFLVPRPGTLVGGASVARFTARFPSNTSEDGAYLSAPVIAILVLCGRHARRDRTTRLLLLFALAAAVASLGPELHVAGRPIAPLPWAVAGHLPLLRYALPQRFTMYVWLATSLLVARWLSRSPGAAWPRYGVVALAGVLLLPNVTSADLHLAQAVPAFFRTSADARRLAAKGRSLLILHPLKGQDMLWQAETGFAFAMPQGHMGNEPPEFRGNHVWGAIRDDRPASVRPAAFLTFLRRHRVSAVVVSPGATADWSPLLRESGLVGEHVDGVTVYRVGRAARPSCVRTLRPWTSPRPCSTRSARCRSSNGSSTRSTAVSSMTRSSSRPTRSRATCAARGTS